MYNKTIYLASPYGFSDHWRVKLLPEFITKLESMGARVWELSFRNSDFYFSIPGWANKVASSNFRDLKDSEPYLQSLMELLLIRAL